MAQPQVWKKWKRKAAAASLGILKVRLQIKDRLDDAVVQTEIYKPPYSPEIPKEKMAQVRGKKKVQQTVEIKTMVIKLIKKNKIERIVVARVVPHLVVTHHVVDHLEAQTMRVKTTTEALKILTTMDRGATVGKTVKTEMSLACHTSNQVYQQRTRKIVSRTSSMPTYLLHLSEREEHQKRRTTEIRNRLIARKQMSTVVLTTTIL